MVTWLVHKPCKNTITKGNTMMPSDIRTFYAKTKAKYFAMVEKHGLYMIYEDFQ